MLQICYETNREGLEVAPDGRSASVGPIRVGAYLLIALLCQGTGWKVRGWYEASEAEKERLIEERCQERNRNMVAEASDSTAKAIRGIRTTNTTIYQNTRQEVIREPMDPACRLPAGWMRNTNDARAGEIDKSLLQPCPPPVEVRVADDGTGDPAELALADIALTGQYHECVELHQGLIEAVKAS